MMDLEVVVEPRSASVADGPASSTHGTPAVAGDPEQLDFSGSGAPADGLYWMYPGATADMRRKEQVLSLVSAFASGKVQLVLRRNSTAKLSEMYRWVASGA